MSPLGKYAQQVAAVVAVSVILGVMFGRLFLGVTDPLLDSMAQVALGAVFGSAAATHINGAALTAAHARLDALQAPPASQAPPPPPTG